MTDATRKQLPLEVCIRELTELFNASGPIQDYVGRRVLLMDTVAHLYSLRATPAAPTADTARLDWLSKQTMAHDRTELGFYEAGVEPGEYGSTISQWDSSFYINDETQAGFSTLREAIDAAMFASYPTTEDH